MCPSTSLSKHFEMMGVSVTGPQQQTLGGSPDLDNPIKPPKYLLSQWQRFITKSENVQVVFLLHYLVPGVTTFPALPESLFDAYALLNNKIEGLCAQSIICSLIRKPFPLSECPSLYLPTCRSIYSRSAAECFIWPRAITSVNVFASLTHSQRDEFSQQAVESGSQMEDFSCLKRKVMAQEERHGHCLLCLTVPTFLSLHNMHDSEYYPMNGQKYVDKPLHMLSCLHRAGTRS